MSPENVRYVVIMKNWYRLNASEKDLIFSYMVGAGGYLEDDEPFQRLLKEIKKMEGVLSL